LRMNVYFAETNLFDRAIACAYLPFFSLRTALRDPPLPPFGRQFLPLSFSFPRRLISTLRSITPAARGRTTSYSFSSGSWGISPFFVLVLLTRECLVTPTGYIPSRSSFFSYIVRFVLPRYQKLGFCGLDSFCLPFYE